MERLRVGQRVAHPAFGDGTVVALRDRGRVKVAFDGRLLLPLTLASAEVDLLESGTEPVPRSTPTSRLEVVPAAPGEIPDLRQAVEALRLGIVPTGYVRDYTVAREKELSASDLLLGSGEGFRIVWGDYGTGKTHLLDVYEQVALERGFVASRITLDPKETPPSHPQRLFREIVTSLRYPGVPGQGLEPLFLALADSPAHRSYPGKRGSRVLSPVLLAWNHPDSDAATWAEDYIEGYPMDLEYGERVLRRVGWKGPRPLALSDYRTYGRMYVHLVGTLASWACDAGYEGLVILFDEVEYIETIRGESRRLAEEVLRHYAAVTVPRENLGFDPDRLYRGGKMVHRGLPLRYSPDQRLSVVMALTPLPEAEEIAHRLLTDRDHDLVLTPLTSGNFRDLVNRVAGLYARAHPDFALPRATVARIAEKAREDAILSDPNPREVVRAAVLEFDSLRIGGRRAG